MANERKHVRSLSYDFGRKPPTVIDLQDDEDYESDVTLSDKSVERRPVAPLQQLEPESDAMFHPLPASALPSITLKVGKTVELRGGDFLHITLITRHRLTKETLLRGLRFRRNSKLDGLLERKTNEVALILKYDDSDARDITRHSTESVLPSNVIKIRRLIRSNLQYPSLSCHGPDNPNPGMSDEWYYTHGTLICRLKVLDYGKNEGVVQSLTRKECDESYFVDEEALRISFRDESIKGGSSSDWLPGEQEQNTRERERCNYNDPLDFYPNFEIFDLASIHRPKSPKMQCYTLGDGYCGAGGASRGAKAAGLRVIWGFDFDRAAIESYQLNFSATHCWAIAAHQFIVSVTDDLKVDILHISPPCQTFSPAHTRPGKDDGMNEATFLATSELIKRSKPRIVTLEETFGLTRTEDNLIWFKAMIQMFTSLGFSARWKVFDLRDFGLPQPRKRLFLYASW